MIYLGLIHRPLDVNLIEFFKQSLKIPKPKSKVYKQKQKKCQKGFLESIKHVFLHDYFLHMQSKSKVRDSKPNECKTIGQII